MYVIHGNYVHIIQVFVCDLLIFLTTGVDGKVSVDK